MRDDPQGHAQAGVFDQLHDVGVRHADDGLAVHRQDPVPHLQLPAAVGWAALDDAADFVRHSCGRKRDAVSGGRLLRSARWLTDCLFVVSFCTLSLHKVPSRVFSGVWAMRGCSEMCVTDVPWEGMYN